MVPLNSATPRPPKPKGLKAQPWTIPTVSIVVPCWGLPYRILPIKLVKPKKGTTIETIGSNSEPNALDPKQEVTLKSTGFCGSFRKQGTLVSHLKYSSSILRILMLRTPKKGTPNFPPMLRFRDLQTTSTFLVWGVSEFHPNYCNVGTCLRHLGPLLGFL